MGHPQPFNLKMIGIGNEQWGPQYMERYTKFQQVIRRSIPKSSWWPPPGRGRTAQIFNLAWSQLRELHADIVDEHCYARPDWFYNSMHRYDKYDRNGPKVFFARPPDCRPRPCDVRWLVQARACSG